MDIFRFIDGENGLSQTPFLTFDYRTVSVSETRIAMTVLIGVLQLVGGAGHPGFMTQKQPAMEKHLRAAIDPNFGDLRSESTVVAIEEDKNHVFVQYTSKDGQLRTLRARFLVGADGKTGYVRKKYLEPKGIAMEKNPK